MGVYLSGYGKLGVGEAGGPCLGKEWAGSSTSKVSLLGAVGPRACPRIPATLSAMPLDISEGVAAVMFRITDDLIIVLHQLTVSSLSEGAG